jgi:hypothetical protein
MAPLPPLMLCACACAFNWAIDVLTDAPTRALRERWVRATTLGLHTAEDCILCRSPPSGGCLAPTTEHGATHESAIAM